MKFAAVCVIVIALVVVQSPSAQSLNIEWGKRETDDVQILREFVMKKSSFLRVVTRDIVVDYKGAARITQITVTDQHINGNGGYATLSRGGPGYTKTTIHLRSRRGHGFNFIIEIFGHNQ